jgi:hypothetical protein
MSPTPGVVTWFRVYCGALALVYLGCIVGGIFVLVTSGDTRGTSDAVSRGVMLGYGAALIVLGLVLSAAFAAGVFLPPKPWVWVYGIVLISIGFMSACCLPFCVALLIFWLKPEARAYFGRPA